MSDDSRPAKRVPREATAEMIEAMWQRYVESRGMWYAAWLGAYDAVPAESEAVDMVGRPLSDVEIAAGGASEPGRPCWCGDYPGGACDGCGKERPRANAAPEVTVVESLRRWEGGENNVWADQAMHAADLIERLAAERDEVTKRNEALGRECAALMADVAAARAEAEGLRKDAERYRWLRENGICIGDAPTSYVYSKEADRFVDHSAARAAEAKPGKE